jgi:hypothetical protein
MLISYQGGDPGKKGPHHLWEHGQCGHAFAVIVKGVCDDWQAPTYQQAAWVEMALQV